MSLLEAVNLALTPTTPPDVLQQALSYIDSIKSTHEGYEQALELLSSPNHQLRFFAYQVIEETTPLLNPTELAQTVSQMNALINDDVPVYLRNKYAAIYARLFCATYLEILPNILTDLMKIAPPDAYTRIIMAIHSEIGDKLLARSAEEQERNTLVKDAIRERDMAGLVESFYGLLGPQHSGEIHRNALTIIGHYVSWMDTSLFATSAATRAVSHHLSVPESRVAAAETLGAMVAKKMPAQNKLALLEGLDIPSAIRQTADQDLEYAEAAAKLINQVGIDLVICGENGQDISKHLSELWPLVFDFLSHDSDQVVVNILGFIQAFLAAVKKTPNGSFIVDKTALLERIVSKMKYKEDAEEEDEDEEDDEVPFEEVRARLKVLQTSVSVLWPDVYMDVVPRVVEQALAAESWPVVELGLYELGNLAEYMRSGPKEAAGGLKDVLARLVHSNAAESTHPRVQISFFELVVRQFTILKPNRETSERVLHLFTGESGLFSSSLHVRRRGGYLLSRFVRLARGEISVEAASAAVEKMAPLLSTIDEEDAGFLSQLHLFEAAGLLTAVAVSYVGPILTPIFNILKTSIESDRDVSDTLAGPSLSAHHALTSLATFVRGFDSDPKNDKRSKQPNSSVVSLFCNAAEAVLSTLEAFSYHPIVREAARSAFSRLIPVVRGDISAHLPRLVSSVLGADNLETGELSDFLSLLAQVVHAFQNDAGVYSLLDQLWTPTFHRVMEFLDKTADDEPDMVRAHSALKKSFMNLVGALVQNHAASVLATETNRSELPPLLDALLAWASDLNDTSVSRAAITQLGNIVSVFGPGGSVADERDRFGGNVAPVDGIDAYFAETIPKLALGLPFQASEFNVRDAQYRAVAQELGVLLCVYGRREGGVVAGYVERMGGDVGEFMREMGDQRGFRRFFVDFLEKRAS